MIASSCDSTADRVDIIEVDGTSFEPSPDPASPGAALATLAAGFDVVSVEWVDDGSDSDSDMKKGGKKPKFKTENDEFFSDF